MKVTAEEGAEFIEKEMKLYLEKKAVENKNPSLLRGFGIFQLPKKAESNKTDPNADVSNKVTDVTTKKNTPGQ